MRPKQNAKDRQDDSREDSSDLATARHARLPHVRPSPLPPKQPITRNATRGHVLDVLTVPDRFIGMAEPDDFINPARVRT